jgi:hypothetical protein
MYSNCKVKIPINSFTSCLFKSIGQLCTSLDAGYVISCITHPATSTNEYSTMVDLDPNEDKECLITVFGDETIALLEFIEKFLNSTNYLC